MLYKSFKEQEKKPLKDTEGDLNKLNQIKCTMFLDSVLYCLRILNPATKEKKTNEINKIL